MRTMPTARDAASLGVRGMASDFSSKSFLHLQRSSPHTDCERKVTLPPQQCGSARGSRPAWPSAGTCTTTLLTGPTRVASACSAAHRMQALCTSGTYDGTYKPNIDKAGGRARGVCAPAARSWALRGVEADSLPPGRRRWNRRSPGSAILTGISMEDTHFDID